LKKGEFEHHPIGTLDKLVQEAVEKRVQKKDPENHFDTATMTREAFAKLTYMEKVEFKAKNPELYKKLTSKT
jgi:hypothetical protein